jgi:hypothetical protein
MAAPTSTATQPPLRHTISLPPQNKEEGPASRPRSFTDKPHKVLWFQRGQEVTHEQHPRPSTFLSTFPGAQPKRTATAVIFLTRTRTSGNFTRVTKSSFRCAHLLRSMRQCIVAITLAIIAGSEAFIGKDSCKEMTCTNGVNNLPKAKVEKPLPRLYLCACLAKTKFAIHTEAGRGNAALTPACRAVEGKLGEHQVPGFV